MRIKVDLRGLADMRNMADEMYANVQTEVDNAVEKRALKVVNDIKTDAPRKTGKLANSFDIVDQYTKVGQRAIGTEVEYATRQEYEHATKKGFVRNNITKHEALLQQDLQEAVNKGTGGA